LAPWAGEDCKDQGSGCGPLYVWVLLGSLGTRTWIMSRQLQSAAPPILICDVDRSTSAAMLEVPWTSMCLWVSRPCALAENETRSQASTGGRHHLNTIPWSAATCRRLHPRRLPRCVGSVEIARSLSSPTNWFTAMSCAARHHDVLSKRVPALKLVSALLHAVVVGSFSRFTTSDLRSTP
jgi:hypothetical protein